MLGCCFITVFKKDINKVLLFLIIVPLILFAISTNYYENKIKNISDEYNKNQVLLKATGNAILQSNETNLKETFQKDKEFLEKRYFDLKTENEVLRNDKEKLQTELNVEIVAGGLQQRFMNFWCLPRRSAGSDPDQSVGVLIISFTNGSMELMLGIISPAFVFHGIVCCVF